MARRTEIDTILPQHLQEALKIEDKIGSGIYGNVYRCTLKEDPTTCYALKKLKTNTHNDTHMDEKKRFDWKNMYGISQLTLREIVILKSLRHPHIIELIDFHIEVIASQEISPSYFKKAQEDMQDFCHSIEIERDFHNLVTIRSPRISNKHSEPPENSLQTHIWLIFELADIDLEKLIRRRHLEYFRWEASLLNQFGEETVYSLHPDHPIFRNIPLPGLDETNVKGLMYQLFQALKYCHSKRATHRDIKPTNIFLSRDPKLSPFGILKLGDFGLARLIDTFTNKPKTEEVVTLLYRAPEILLGENNYTSAVDIWSAAAIMGECILGRPLFGGKGEFDVIMRIFGILGTPKIEELTILKHFSPLLPRINTCVKDNLRLRFTERYSKKVLLSDMGLDLLENLLNYHPKDRMGADDALKHPWFNDIKNIIGEKLLKTYDIPNLTLPKHYLAPHPSSDPTSIYHQMDVSTSFSV